MFKGSSHFMKQFLLTSILILGMQGLFFSPAKACDTNIKKTDGYKELAEKLKCLNAKIEIVLKKSPEFKRQTIVLFEQPELLDFKTDKCIKTSSLPSDFRMVIRKGLKFCNDDGWVWGTNRINNNSYPLDVLNSNRTASNCSVDGDCIWELNSTPKQKMRVSITKENYKNQQMFIGRFKRMEE